MNKVRNWLALLPALVLFASGLSLAGSGSPAKEDPERQFLWLSLPSLKVDPSERIVAFHFAVQSGRIARVSDLPIGWNIEVDNDPSWNTRLSGSIRVASAALDASFFRHFMLIEKETNPEQPLSVNGNIDVSGNFSTTRKIPVDWRDFAIHPRLRSSSRESSGANH